MWGESLYSSQRRKFGFQPTFSKFYHPFTFVGWILSLQTECLAFFLLQMDRISQLVMQQASNITSYDSTHQPFCCKIRIWTHLISALLNTYVRRNQCEFSCINFYYCFQHCNITHGIENETWIRYDLSSYNFKRSFHWYYKYYQHSFHY